MKMFIFAFVAIDFPFEKHLAHFASLFSGSFFVHVFRVFLFQDYVIQKRKNKCIERWDGKASSYVFMVLNFIYKNLIREIFS